MPRLIDADALKEMLKEEHDYLMQDPEVGSTMKWCEAVRYYNATQIIEKAPTVDAVEVVHGRWEFSHTTTVEKFAVVKCSNCGHEAFAIANYVKEGHYCPNCGADMRGDGNG